MRNLLWILMWGNCLFAGLNLGGFVVNHSWFSFVVGIINAVAAIYCYDTLRWTKDRQRI